MLPVTDTFLVSTAACSQDTVAKGALAEFVDTFKDIATDQMIFV